MFGEAWKDKHNTIYEYKTFPIWQKVTYKHVAFGLTKWHLEENLLQ